MRVCRVLALDVNPDDALRAHLSAAARLRNHALEADAGARRAVWPARHPFWVQIVPNEIWA